MLAGPVLRRARAGWPVLPAAFLVLLVSVSVIAAGVLYGDAVGRADHGSVGVRPLARPPVGDGGGSRGGGDRSGREAGRTGGVHGASLGSIPVRTVLGPAEQMDGQPADLPEPALAPGRMGGPDALPERLAER
jgi:hypothetical protein